MEIKEGGRDCYLGVEDLHTDNLLAVDQELLKVYSLIQIRLGELTGRISQCESKDGSEDILEEIEDLVQFYQVNLKRVQQLMLSNETDMMHKYQLLQYRFDELRARVTSMYTYDQDNVELPSARILPSAVTDDSKMPLAFAWIRKKAELLKRSKKSTSTADRLERGYVMKKSDPKAFFANERTFLSWLQFCALLMTVSLNLLNYGDHISRVVGAFFIIISSAISFYALARFQLRAYQMRTGKQLLKMEDIYGPTILCLLLVTALCVNFYLRAPLVFRDTTALEVGIVEDTAIIDN